MTFKDNPDQPIEISDKRITEKMLEKGRKSADNATVPTPGGSNENRDTVKKDLTVEKPVIIVQDESQQKLIDDLKRQLEQIKTNEKLLIRYVDFLLPSLVYFFSKLDLDKGPFKYYVIMFLTVLGPPTSLMIYSTVNHQKLPFSDPTHPPL